jgi:hypothetical protein
MSNPDTTTSMSTNALPPSAIPVSLFFMLVIIFLFKIKDSIPVFNIVLWVVIPILVIVVTTGVNAISQYTSCRKTNIGKAILGSLVGGLGILISLGIASISYCRIPIASFFAPLMVGKSVDITKNKSNTTINSLKNSNSKECCVPKLTLEMVESRYPIIAGFSYGFYSIFGILFGIVVGNNISSIC